MFYLRFSHLKSYCERLAHEGIPSTYLDIHYSPLPGGGVLYSAIATQRIGARTLAVFHETIFVEEPKKRRPAANSAASRKAETAVWKAFSQREEIVRAANLEILRGILTTTEPSILH